jgi:hypothetical protein
MNATHITILFNLENQTKVLSYTTFPVKKINMEIILKIMRNRCLNFSSYSHPEIREFQVVTENMRPGWLIFRERALTHTLSVSNYKLF